MRSACSACWTCQSCRPRARGPRRICVLDRQAIRLWPPDDGTGEPGARRMVRHSGAPIASSRGIPQIVAATTRAPACGRPRGPMEQYTGQSSESEARGLEVPHAAYPGNLEPMRRAAFAGYPRRSSPHLQRHSGLGVRRAVVDNGARQAGGRTTLVRLAERSSAKAAFQPYDVGRTNWKVTNTRDPQNESERDAAE